MPLSHSFDIVPLMNEVVEAGIHGLNVSFRRDAGPAEHFAAGLADVRTQRPMAANSFHRIASVTKLFTATAVLQLMTNHHLELDSPVATFVPEHIGQRLGGVTIHHLLNHTSGLVEPELLLFPSIRNGSLSSVVEHRARAILPGDLAELCLAAPAHSAPGEQYWYSNTNYHLLGLVIESITGRGALDVIETDVIAPAGLPHTYFPRGYVPLPAPTNTGYDSLYRLVEPELEISSYDMSCVYTAGALVSTPGDLLAFAAQLLGGSLLPPGAVKAMTTTIRTEGGLEVGLGLQRTTAQGRTVYAAEGTFFGAQTVLMTTEDGSRSWVMTWNTTKYQVLGADGWPQAHPADSSIAALGGALTALALV
jgi:D-alanyl-D-alanine carboxypeptidase